MTDDLRTRADANLTAAAATLRLADPRPAYRERLRILKEERPEAFATALRHYEENVLPAIANDGDVMSAWVRYGAALGAHTAPGRMVRVDETGRASAFAPPVQAGSLILHIPDENSAPILVATAPAEPTAAQQATLNLLVNRKLSL